MVVEQEIRKTYYNRARPISRSCQTLNSNGILGFVAAAGSQMSNTKCITPQSCPGVTLVCHLVPSLSRSLLVRPSLIDLIGVLGTSFPRRVVDQHWAVVEPMSSRADWVSYHYYVGLLKISEDKASGSLSFDRSMYRYIVWSSAVLLPSCRILRLCSAVVRLVNRWAVMPSAFVLR